MTKANSSSLPAVDRDQRGPQRSLWVDAILGCLVGLLGWYALGYHDVLPPGRIDWLLGGTARETFYDPATYFLGWHFFRHSPWTFPLGLNPTYGLEYSGSIAFSDSLPVLAFLFKPFSRWEGTNFQYFGIWILLCFVLQGLFASLLASRFAARRVARLLITAFFVLSPIMMERSWTEFPLMGHWLLLWALYLYFREPVRSFRWLWIVLPVLGVVTTFYLVPMVLAVWMADAIRRLFRKPSSILWLVLEAACIGGAVYLAMWITGYFVITVKSAQTTNFGNFALNALGPIDPWGWSQFLKNMPKSPFWMGEGFSYFGLGMIFLTALGIYEFMKQPVPRRLFLRILPLLFVSLILTAFAFSTKVAFATHVWVIPVSDDLLRFAGIFRSSGRMFWVPYYCIWLASFYLVTRNLKSWQAVMVLAVMLFVQIADFWPSHYYMRDRNAHYPAWHTPLKSPFWAVAAKKYHRIIVYPSGVTLAYAPLDYWGANHGMSTNAAYLGRFPDVDVILPISMAREASLKQNRLKADILYIVPEEGRVTELKPLLHRIHGIGKIDGYNVVAPYWFEGGKAAGPGDLKPGGM